MPLKSIVKVSHLSNLSDARYCAGMGVDMLGFQAIPGHDHYIPREVFQDIRGWVSGPAIVAELYGISSTEQIEQVLQAYAPDYLEMTIAEYCKYRDHVTRPCLIACSRAEDLALLNEDDDVKYVIADDTVSCGDVARKNLEVLVPIATVDRLNERLQEGCFHGFVLEASQETRPGVTNYDQLGEILEALEDEG